MKKKRIVLNKPHIVDGHEFPSGSTIELPESSADALVLARHAKEVETQPQAPAAPKAK